MRKKASPKIALECLRTLIRVWSTLRPNSSFSGRTLEQFKIEVKPSFDTRAELEIIEGNRRATIVRRDDADAMSLDLYQRIVNAIKGHPDEGEDGELYAGLGYIRKTSRAGGRPRRGAAEVPVASEPAKTAEEVKTEKDAA